MTESNVVFKNVAFTGPSRDVPADMKTAIHEYVGKMPSGSVVLSGGAHGVDTLAASAAAVCGLDIRLVVPRDRMWNRDLEKGLEDLGYGYDKIVVPGDYRDRNEKMVELCDMLVACLLKAPGEFYRSGEWMTKNIALKAGIPVKNLDWR